MRAIFLDIDGVICCNQFGRLEDRKLQLLRGVVQQTGAKVVLSTDWRRVPKLKQQLIGTLRDYGMDVIGSTPMRQPYLPVRPQEITDWLESYNRAAVDTNQEPITNFVAVDDRSLLTEHGGDGLQGRFVHTRNMSGLTDQCAQRMAARLLAPEPNSAPIPGLPAGQQPSEPPHSPSAPTGPHHNGDEVALGGKEPYSPNAAMLRARVGPEAGGMAGGMGGGALSAGGARAPVPATPLTGGYGASGAYGAPPAYEPLSSVQRSIYRSNHDATLRHRDIMAAGAPTGLLPQQRGQTSAGGRGGAPAPYFPNVRQTTAYSPMRPGPRSHTAAANSRAHGIQPSVFARSPGMQPWSPPMRPPTLRT